MGEQMNGAGQANKTSGPDGSGQMDRTSQTDKTAPSEMSADFKEQLRRINETNAFMRHNHIRAVKLSDTGARVEAVINGDSLNAMQGIHGGLMFIMAETAAGLAVRNDGRKYVTLDSSFRFISSAAGSAPRLAAESLITKRGRTVCFCRSQVLEPVSGKILAEGEFTFYCLDAAV